MHKAVWNSAQHSPHASISCAHYIFYSCLINYIAMHQLRANCRCEAVELVFPTALPGQCVRSSSDCHQRQMKLYGNNKEGNEFWLASTLQRNFFFLNFYSNGVRSETQVFPGSVVVLVASVYMNVHKIERVWKYPLFDYRMLADWKFTSNNFLGLSHRKFSCFSTFTHSTELEHSEEMLWITSHKWIEYVNQSINTIAIPHSLSLPLSSFPFHSVFRYQNIHWHIASVRRKLNLIFQISGSNKNELRVFCKFCNFQSNS